MDKGPSITLYGAVGSLIGYAFSEIHNTHPYLTIVACSTIGALIGHYDQRETPSTGKNAGVAR